MAKGLSLFWHEKKLERAEEAGKRGGPEMDNIGMLSLGCTVLFGGLALTGITRKRIGLGIAALGLGLVLVSPFGARRAGVSHEEIIGRLKEVRTPSLRTETQKEREVNTGSPAVPVFRFSDRFPFPEKFDVITPGMRVSDAKSAYPEGRLEPDSYSIEPKVGIFSSIHFLFLPMGEDPAIERIVFFFNAPSRPMIVEEALKSFGTARHESAVLGTQITWPNINGWSILIKGDIMSISKASKKITLPHSSRRAWS